MLASFVVLRIGRTPGVAQDAHRAVNLVWSLGCPLRGSLAKAV
jgi:hypothetical protein